MSRGRVRPPASLACRTHVPFTLGERRTGPPLLAGAGRSSARPGRGLLHAGGRLQRARLRRAAAPASPAAAVHVGTAPAGCGVAPPPAVRDAARRAPPPAPAARRSRRARHCAPVTGTVSRYSEDEGHGLIAGDDGETYWVHFMHI